jgi:hypothetical protein
MLEICCIAIFAFFAVLICHLIHRFWGSDSSVAVDSSLVRCDIESLGLYVLISQRITVFIFTIKQKVKARQCLGSVRYYLASATVPHFREQFSLEHLFKLLTIVLGVMFTLKSQLWTRCLCFVWLFSVSLSVVQVQWGLQIPILWLPGTPDTFPLPAFWLWLQLLWQDTLRPAHSTPRKARYANGWGLPAVSVECVLWSIRVCVHCHTRYASTVDGHQRILFCETFVS